MRYLIFFFILIGVQLHAQEILVIDAITGLPIQGVNIISKLQKSGTVSNKEGRLNINSFSPKDTLSIQHLAYQTIQETKSSTKKKTITYIVNLVEEVPRPVK